MILWKRAFLLGLLSCRWSERPRMLVRLAASGPAEERDLSVLSPFVYTQRDAVSTATTAGHAVQAEHQRRGGHLAGGGSDLSVFHAGARTAGGTGAGGRGRAGG